MASHARRRSHCSRCRPTSWSGTGSGEAITRSPARWLRKFLCASPTIARRLRSYIGERGAGRLCASAERAYDIRQLWSPQISVGLMIVRLIWWVSVQWAAIRINQRHVGYFDPLIVGLVVVTKLSLDRDDVAPVREIRPPSDDAGSAY